MSEETFYADPKYHATMLNFIFTQHLINFDRSKTEEGYIDMDQACRTAASITFWRAKFAQYQGMLAMAVEWRKYLNRSKKKSPRDIEQIKFLTAMIKDLRGFKKGAERYLNQNFN